MRKRTLLLLLTITSTSLAEAPYKPIAELMEDNAEALLKNLEGQDGGQGLVETTDIYSGKASIKILPMQRYARNIPNWAYHITENPKPGEYRFVRFAWKADGARGIMLQMHDEKDWNIRFTAGIDAHNWGTKFVSPTPPTEWTVVTRDLFKEFGERTIKGIALTVFDGNAGYFDHIYFGRTIEDLDLIDATGQTSAAPPTLKPDDLEQLWSDLGGSDAPKSYRAFWRLVAASRQSVPFIHRALIWPNNPQATKQIKTWINELEADEFAVRETAAKQLINHLDSAAALLKQAVEEESVGPEARQRIALILKSSAGDQPGIFRIEEAVRALAYAKTPEAKTILKELAGGDEKSPLTQAARVRLKSANPKE